MGHPLERAAKSLQQMATGVDEPLSDLGRIKEVPHTSKIEIATKPMELTHSDISGPFPTIA